MLLEELSDIAANLRMMGDDALAAFANTHKSDPYMFALAVSESTQRKKLRAAQAAPITGPMPTVADSEISQMGGIAQLPARNMEMMADGGIVGGVDDGYDMAVGYGTGGGLEIGYAQGGMVERYQRGGLTAEERARLEADVAALKREIARAKNNEQRLILQTELDKAVQMLGGMPQTAAQKVADKIPVSSAQAAQPSSQPPAPTSERDRLISQIPGQTAAGRTTAPEPERSISDYIFGAGETGLAALTGALSPVTGLARKAGQELVYGKSDPMEKQMAATTFAPRGEAGQAMTQGLAQVAQDLKIPAYLPAMGPAAPSLSRTPRTAELVGKADDAAARVAEEQARLAALVGPPSSAQTPGQARAAATTLAQREGAAGQAARASGMAQQEAAAGRVAAERIGQEAGYAQGAGQRANVAALGATGAQVAAGAEVPPDTGEKPFVPAPGDDSYDRAEKNKFIRQQMEKLNTDLSKKDLVDAAKKAAPEAGKKGWTGEDWVLLGLGLMASKNPNFLGALGEAGVGVIKEKRAQAKEDREERYRSALTREAEAKAKVYESGTGDVAKATAYADKAFDNWLNGVNANPMLKMNITPEQIEEKRRQYLREAYSMYKIALPEGFGTGVASAGGFKVLGSRPG